MANRYFFDKRDMKHAFIKYGLALLVAFPILLGLSFLLANVKSWVRILIYIAILGGVVILSEVIDANIRKRKREKAEQMALEEKERKKQERKAQQKAKKAK